MTVELYCGDCLEIMPTLPQVDAIITDLPYGTTACSWDTVIPFESMWREVKRIDKGVFVTTASQPFTSALIMSNPDWFKVSWYWQKERGTNFQLVKYYPMKVVEECLVFCKGVSIYNPQTISVKPYRHVMPVPKENHSQHMSSSGIDSDGNREYRTHTVKQPENILRFSRDNMVSKKSLHPTQKPVVLYEYLIRTYTNEGDTVLDICAGSGTTGVACVNTNRNFIGIELREDYFKIMQDRIKDAQAQMRLPL